jgi:bromodomain-containing protein 4
VSSPPKPALPSTSSSNSVFEQFKKQALEKNERVSGWRWQQLPRGPLSPPGQDRLARQQEDQRRELRRQAGLEAQRRREEQQQQSHASPSSQPEASPQATPSPAGSGEDTESKLKQRERQREEQRRKREAMAAQIDMTHQSDVMNQFEMETFS